MGVASVELLADDLRVVACRLPATAVRDLAGQAPESLARLRAAALLRELGLPAGAVAAVLDPAGADWDALGAEDAARLRTVITAHQLLCPPTGPDCSLRRLPPRTLVRIRVRAPAARVDAAVAEARAELVGFARSADLTVTGPFTVTFTGVVADHADAQCALPVEELAGSSGRITPGHDPGGVYATTVHTGGPATLAVAYDALAAWMTERGHPVSGPARELYLSDGRVQVCLPVP